MQRPRKWRLTALAEEQLQVGKRTVDRGTTSIRRYVVRKPVEESVTLRDETVSVERRRPAQRGCSRHRWVIEGRRVQTTEARRRPLPR
jgi:hypothetical protein